MPNTRRQVLVSIVGTSALAASDPQAQHQHGQPEPAATTSQTYKPKSFTPAQLRTVGALAEIIIPRTKTPGALDAKVHEIIDERLAGNRRALAVWTKGLSEVNALARKQFRQAYVALNEDQQAAVMVTLAEKSPFFAVLKEATVDAYYSTKEGLQMELGYQGAVPLAEFKGCTHPEHQA